MAASGSFYRMRDPEQAAGGSLLTPLKKLKDSLKLPFKAPSLLDNTQPYFSGIKRFGLSNISLYWKDPFHTLLNLPWPRFILFFFVTYFLQYMSFAFLFWAQSSCVDNLDGEFAHALWMSSRVASTLGFSEIKPKYRGCALVNLTVMVQCVTCSLINFILLGLVFARFSAPFKRASTIRFSTSAVVHRHTSGYWCLEFRVANIRKHQLLKPTVRLVMTAVDSITPSNYMFEHLKVHSLNKQETNLELGFPANVVHLITPDSPLYNLSLLEMDTRMMEILVFVDGIDAMTSKQMSARFAYGSSEIYMNEQFVPLHLEMRGKSLGIDFRDFDKTAPATDEILAEYSTDPSLQAKSINEVRNHIWHLRHQTFKRLTERYSPHLSHPANDDSAGKGTGTEGNSPQANSQQALVGQSQRKYLASQALATRPGSAPGAPGPSGGSAGSGFFARQFRAADGSGFASTDATANPFIDLQADDALLQQAQATKYVSNPFAAEMVSINGQRQDLLPQHNSTGSSAIDVLPVSTTTHESRSGTPHPHYI